MSKPHMSTRETRALLDPSGRTRESTIARSDVEWAPDGSKPCSCGKCLVCQVEALAVPVSAAN